MPKGEGRWWYTARAEWFRCSKCRHRVPDKMAVLRYRSHRDRARVSAMLVHSWPVDGWLIWRECPDRPLAHLQVNGAR